MRILRAADYRRMPWKNGKGETVEVAVFPSDRSIDNFDWRISMATVAENGPFSVFEGVDRTLSVLSGDGIALSIEGQDTVDLRIGSAPHAFPADAAASARLLGTVITDLNVMTRRGRFRHKVGTITAPSTLGPVDGTVLVLCQSGFLEISAGGTPETLHELDCAVFQTGQSAVLAGDGLAFLISVFMAGPSQC